MKRKIAALTVALSLGLAAAAAWALPTTEQVQSAVQQGDYGKAETMLREVVAARPGSAKAHYELAEVLAHTGRFDEARAQARQARQIDPDLKFTQPAKFTEFERLLEREQRAEAAPRSAPPATGLQRTAPQADVAPPAPSGGGLPGWVWGLGGAAVAVLLWRMASARRGGAAPAGGTAGFGQPAPGYPAGAGNVPGYGPQAGYGPAPASGGSGMLGTGLAAAGGFAAGMLADRLLEGHHGQDGVGHLGDGGSLANAAGAGAIGNGVFGNGPADDAAQALEQRPIDFGTAGDWEGGDADVASDGGSDDWS